MNPNTPPPSDDELPDERELAALYARLPKTEPDPALDAAVLAAATRGLPVRRRPRWPIALGTAAVLVLAVGVGWHLGQAPLSEAITEKAALPAASPAGARLARDKASTNAAPAPTPTASKPQRHTAARQAKTQAAPIASPAFAPSPAPMPAPPPVPPAPAAPPAPPAPPSPPADISANAPEESIQGFAAPRAQVAMPTVAAAPAPVADGRLMANPDTYGPDDRIGEIRRLLDHGDRDPALRKLAELRRLYPAYDLPQDLRDLKP